MFLPLITTSCASKSIWGYGLFEGISFTLGAGAELTLAFVGFGGLLTGT